MAQLVWILSIIAVPTLPKVEVISVAGLPILLDDCALFSAVLLGLF